jgi:hypothetical protein
LRLMARRMLLGQIAREEEGVGLPVHLYPVDIYPSEVSIGQVPLTFPRNWLRVSHIGLCYCRVWRNLIQEVESTRGTRGQ